MSHELSREYCRPRAKQIFTVHGEEYYLGGELGDGAVGIVRRATRLKDNATRAVKFLAPDPNILMNQFSTMWQIGLSEKASAELA